MIDKKQYVRHGIILSVVIYTIAMNFAWAESNTQFSRDILKTRGLDNALSDYFSETAKFTPGLHSVSLSVNGKEMGNVTARFGQNGELCATEDFLQQADLAIPAKIALLTDAEDNQQANGACYDYHQDYPTAVITPLPGREALALVVPPEAIDNTLAGAMAKKYHSGGTAGLLNYSLYSTTNKYNDASSTWDQAMLEEGINMDDWLLRSRQSLTGDDGAYSHDNLYTWVQHTFVPWKKELQVGQINTTGTLLSGISLTGAQLSPEDALIDDGASGVTVTGIARSAQARVDVRQGGRLVYSTLVPAGAFSLTDVPIVSLNADLDITVTETDGSQNHFTLPAQAISGYRLNSPSGLTMAAGRYRDDSANRTSTPMLATLSDGQRLLPWLNTGEGIMAAEKYQQLAISLDMLTAPNLLLSSVFKESDDQNHSQRGQSCTLNLTWSPQSWFGFNSSFTVYSQGYRDLPDSLEDDFTQYASQYYGGIHWDIPNLGTFSLSYTQAQGTEGNPNSRYISASWGRNIGVANLSVSWQTQLNQPHDDDDNSATENNGDLLFVNLSFPIGKQQVSTYSHTQHHETSVGLETEGNINDENSYTLATERDTSASSYDFNGSLNSNLHYTQLGVNAGTNGPDGRTYGMTLNGGIVAHAHGVTFSPWPVKDTFAIVNAGKDARDIAISTPSGTVWTDYRGMAVIPSLPAWHNARIEMNTATLPPNVDIDNGFAQVAGARGSVSQVNFHALNIQRALIVVKMSDGSPLKKELPIVDEKNHYMTTSVENGIIFLNDISTHPTLFALNDHGEHLCRITWAQPVETTNSHSYYQQIKGVCQ
jgi:outer membrane usher protein FimD/PapC